MKKSKKVEKLLQNFYDVTVTDPVLLEIMGRYEIVKQTTGIHDETIMLEAFDYLDAKLQKQLREGLNGTK